MRYFLEDVDDQDAFEQSYDTGLENCYILLIKLQMCILLALQTESKLILLVLVDKYRKKAFTRLEAAYHVPRNVLICSHKDTSSGSVDVIRVTT